MEPQQQLFKQLEKLRDSKTIILGIGNTLKGDDGVGSLICQRLSGKVSAEVIDAGTVPENYIQLIIKKAPENLLVIDAIDFSAAAGTVQLFKPEQLNKVIISTHTLSPTFFVNMIRQNIDVDVWFIGIQPEQTQVGQSLCKPVQNALLQITGMLTKIWAV